MKTLLLILCLTVASVQAQPPTQHQQLHLLLSINGLIHGALKQDWAFYQGIISVLQSSIWSKYLPMIRESIAQEVATASVYPATKGVIFDFVRETTALIVYMKYFE